MKPKKLAIDIGNSNIKIYDGIKTDIIKSMATTNAMTNKNIVSYNEQRVHFGVGTPLAAQDKTTRKYMQETILLASYRMFGSGQHNIQLAIGLPLNRYKAQKDDFLITLKAIGSIEGEVDNNAIQIEFEAIEVFAEGYSTLDYIIDNIQHVPCAIIDMGYKTTDVILLSEDGAGDLQIDGYDTFNTGMNEVYESLKSDLIVKTGVTLDSEQIESMHIKKDINVNIDLAKSIITGLYNKIELKFNDIKLRHLYIVGGGADTMSKLIDVKKKTTFDLDTSIYANVKGYYEQL